MGNQASSEYAGEAEVTRSATPRVLTPEEMQSAIPGVLGVGQAHFVSQMLRTVVLLKVPDVIGSETLTVAEIVGRINRDSIDEDGLLRALRLLACATGTFTESAKDGEYAFSLTATGALLQTGVAGQPSMACGMRHWLEGPTWAAWAAVPSAVAGVTDGGSPYEVANGKPVFQYYAEHPESAAPFNEFMSFFSAGELEPVTQYPWAKFNGKTVVDVGGNYGPVMGAVKAKFPEVTCISFDLPEVINAAETSVDGVALVAGDMFKPETIPACNAIFMKHILHDWSDADCVRILKSCHAALPDDGAVVLAEGVLPEAGKDTPLKVPQVHLDALMYIIGGKERTLSQFIAIASEAGFIVEGEPLATPAPMCQLVTLVKAPPAAEA